MTSELKPIGDLVDLTPVEFVIARALSPPEQPPIEPGHGYLFFADLSLADRLGWFTWMQAGPGVPDSSHEGLQPWLEALGSAAMQDPPVDADPFFGRRTTAALEQLVASLEARIAKGPDGESRSRGARDELRLLGMLRALMGAMSERPDAIAHLAELMHDEQSLRVMDEWTKFSGGSVVTARIGQVVLATSSAPDVFLTTLIAGLGRAGALSTARAWAEWARRSSDAFGRRCVSVALAATDGDHEAVLALTDAPLNAATAMPDDWPKKHLERLVDGFTVTLLAHRAWAFKAIGEDDVALLVLDEAVRASQRLEGDQPTNILYVRGVERLDQGRTTDALRDLNAVVAKDAGFLDARALVRSAEAPSDRPTRHIPARVRREVWRRDGGRCTECNGDREIEYDHLYPWSKGGSSTARNIRLLCAPCNRKKGDRI